MSNNQTVICVINVLYHRYTDNPIINLSVVRCQRCSVAKSMAETTTNNVSMSDIFASKLQLTPIILLTSQQPRRK